MTTFIEQIFSSKHLLESPWPFVSTDDDGSGFQLGRFLEADKEYAHNVLFFAPFSS